MRWVTLLVVLSASAAMAQSAVITDCRLGKCSTTTEDFGYTQLFPPGEFPDAPQPQPVPKHSIWDKWDYNRPQRTYAETLKNPWFYGMALGLIGANLADLVEQQSAFRNGCVDGDGKRPSFLEQGGLDFAADGAVIVMAFFLKRAHIKVIPEAMLGYGIQIHVRSAIRQYGETCR